jgi:hypothetical protein
MFNRKLKSDYVSFFNKTDQQTLPNGYPCTFDSECTSPAVCQFNICTINIGGNNVDDLANVCKGKPIKDCAKEMQKERERTEVPIYIPSFPSTTNISSTGGTGGNSGSNVSTVNINTPNKCKYDKDCLRNEICLSNICMDKSNFPLIARQKRLLSINNVNNMEGLHDDYYYFNNKL